MYIYISIFAYMGTMQRSLDTPFPHMIERDKERLSFVHHRHVWLWKAPPSTFCRIFASVAKDNGKHKFPLLFKDFKALSADVSFPHIEKVSNNYHMLIVHSLFLSHFEGGSWKLIISCYFSKSAKIVANTILIAILYVYIRYYYS